MPTYVNDSIPTKSIEVYILYPLTSKTSSSSLPKDFFDQALDQLEKNNQEQFLFFNLESACHHLRFMNKQQIILHAVVPEMAIQGQFDKVVIKPEVLTPAHIHGCYTCDNEEPNYVKNPASSVISSDFMV